MTLVLAEWSCSCRQLWSVRIAELPEFLVCRQDTIQKLVQSGGGNDLGPRIVIWLSIHQGGRDLREPVSMHWLDINKLMRNTAASRNGAVLLSRGRCALVFFDPIPNLFGLMWHNDSWSFSMVGRVYGRGVCW